MKVVYLSSKCTMIARYLISSQVIMIMKMGFHPLTFTRICLMRTRKVQKESLSQKKPSGSSTGSNSTHGASRGSVDSSGRRVHARNASDSSSNNLSKRIPPRVSIQSDAIRSRPWRGRRARSPFSLTTLKLRVLALHPAGMNLLRPQH